MAVRSERYLFWQRILMHPLQALAAVVLYGLARMLPLDAASGLGARVGRWIGPHMSTTKRARANLRMAYPEKTEDEVETIIAAMWDNVGRTVFEFPHATGLDILGDPDRFEIVGREHVDAMRTDGKPGIFVSGHLANWEIMGVAGARLDLPVSLIYREPDNPWLRGVFSARKPHPESELIPKGTEGARQTMRLLKDGGHLGILVDQKMNDGIAVPFFGRDAMTAPAVAQLAMRFNCPLHPVRVERLNGARFRITIYPPMDIPNSGDKAADVLALMTEINQLLES
ncbi:MAG: lauroyl acyltransferase, partial [Rhodospirillales bacterium]|nr:lauroyl acyltransferase [Rhodospirillales bacterium]